MPEFYKFNVHEYFNKKTACIYLLSLLFLCPASSANAGGGFFDLLIKKKEESPVAASSDKEKKIETPAAKSVDKPSAKTAEPEPKKQLTKSEEKKEIAPAAKKSTELEEIVVYKPLNLQMESNEPKSPTHSEELAALNESLKAAPPAPKSTPKPAPVQTLAKAPEPASTPEPTPAPASPPKPAPKPAATPEPQSRLIPAAAKAEPPKAKPKYSAEQYGHIINLAGKQRMLSQKMAKEALMIHAGVGVDLNKKYLAATMSLFEKTLTGLKTGDESLHLPKCENEAILSQLKLVWKNYQEIAPIYKKLLNGAQLSGADSIKIQKDSMAVLKNMVKAVKMFNEDAASVLTGKGDLGKTIDLAGRQRMLSQKISKEILLVYLDVNHDHNQAELIKTSKLFYDTLQDLKGGSDNQEIRTQLEVIDEVWSFIYPTIETISVMGEGGMTSIEMTVLDAFNVPLLKESNNAVQMYEKLAGK